MPFRVFFAALSIAISFFILFFKGMPVANLTMVYIFIFWDWASRKPLISTLCLVVFCDGLHWCKEKRLC